MTIVKKDEFRVDVDRIFDLTGPQGNAFFLLGTARKWAKDLGRDADKIIEEMQESDYDHLVEVFEREFGDFCTLLR